MYFIILFSVAYFGSESLNSTRKDWELSMGVNVMGSAFMVQAVLEVFQRTDPKVIQGTDHEVTQRTDHEVIQWFKELISWAIQGTFHEVI